MPKKKKPQVQYEYVSPSSSEAEVIVDRGSDDEPVRKQMVIKEKKKKKKVIQDYEEVVEHSGMRRAETAGQARKRLATGNYDMTQIEWGTDGHGDALIKGTGGKGGSKTGLGRVRDGGKKIKAYEAMTGGG